MDRQVTGGHYSKENLNMNIPPTDGRGAQPRTPAELVESVAPMVIAWAETAAAHGASPVVIWAEDEGLTLGYACPSCAETVPA